MAKITKPVLHQRASYDVWKTKNTILADSEIGVEKALPGAKSARFKIGNGTSAWNDLAYSNAPLVEMNRAPSNTDDKYEVGQVWKNTTGTKKFYVLESVVPSAAVWKQVLTIDDIVDNGVMLKSAYDTNEDGKVDAAEKADKLSTERTFSVGGDVKADSKTFDGSQNVALNIELKPSGVTAGTYTKVVINEKGLATAGSQATKVDVGLGNVVNAEQATKAEFENYKSESLSERERIEAIARGKSRATVHATVAALDAWLAVAANKAGLAIGDNFYIVARDVPDYWWDGTQKQELETEKVDLSEYPKTTAVQTMIESEVNRLSTELAAVLALKAPLKSPVLTDVPTAPTAALGTKTDQLATTRFVINELLDIEIDGGDLDLE